MFTEKFFAMAGGLDLVVLYILLALSVTSLAVIMERFFALSKIAKSSRRVRELLESDLQNNQLGSLKKIIDEGDSIESRAIALLLKQGEGKGLSSIEDLYSSYVLIVRPQLEKYLNFLATIGSNAPYIGLLGTVLGIMKAFHDLASQSETGMQAVMSGISGALLATAAGLFVAIPAVMAYNYFQRKVKSILQNLELAKDLTLVWLKSQEK